jgi:cardiolipin synthase
VAVKDLLDKIDHGFTWMTSGKEPDQRHVPPRKRVRNFKVISVLALIALVIQTGLLVLALFSPGLPYKVSKGPPDNLRSDRVVQTLEALTGAHLYFWSKLDVLTNGDQFYKAELDAIRGAQRSINLEVYIFQTGDIGRQFIDALTERARAGVQVKVLIDAIGALTLTKAPFQQLIAAGGEVEWYHPLRLTTWPRINNRTHRELLIVDGHIGFIGGAGVADHWYKDQPDEPRWRDTMVRVEGDAVTGLQAVFAENWLESSGEIIIGQAYFPFTQAAVRTTALVVGSSPSVGQSTKARVLFQTLLAAASKSIYITTPYFLPDTSARTELIRAVERGVDVKIVVPGKHSDHLLTRRSSRRLYGPLLKAGARIYEYQSSMIHTKTLVVDSIWSVVGTTNFDSRSFLLNDEVNLAVMDAEFAARIEQDFERDMSQSREITYEQWVHRPWLERAHEQLGSLLERQQ